MKKDVTLAQLQRSKLIAFQMMIPLTSNEEWVLDVKSNFLEREEVCMILMN